MRWLQMNPTNVKTRVLSETKLKVFEVKFLQHKTRLHPAISLGSCQNKFFCSYHRVRVFRVLSWNVFRVRWGKISAAPFLPPFVCFCQTPTRFCDIVHQACFNQGKLHCRPWAWKHILTKSQFKVLQRRVCGGNLTNDFIISTFFCLCFMHLLCL